MCRSDKIQLSLARCVPKAGVLPDAKCVGWGQTAGVDGMGLWVRGSDGQQESDVWNMVDSVHTSVLSSSGKEGGVGWDCIVMVFL